MRVVQVNGSEHRNITVLCICNATLHAWFGQISLRDLVKKVRMWMRRANDVDIPASIFYLAVAASCDFADCFRLGQ
jgi:hypothetical protein